MRRLVALFVLSFTNSAYGDGKAGIRLDEIEREEKDLGRRLSGTDLLIAELSANLAALMQGRAPIVAQIQRVEFHRQAARAKEVAETAIAELEAAMLKVAESLFAVRVTSNAVHGLCYGKPEGSEYLNPIVSRLGNLHLVVTRKIEKEGRRQPPDTPMGGAVPIDDSGDGAAGNNGGRQSGIDPKMAEQKVRIERTARHKSGPKCSVCVHPEREAIDVAIVGQQKLSELEKHYSPNRYALGRHRSHIIELVTRSPEGEKLARADTIVAGGLLEPGGNTFPRRLVRSYGFLPRTEP